MDFANTCYRIRCQAGCLGGVVTSTEQGEAVVLQAQDVQSLEGIDVLRVVDGSLRETITCYVSTTEALGVRQVTVAEDTTFAIVFVDGIISCFLSFWLCFALVEVFVLLRDVTIGIGILVIIIMLVVITEEVGALRQFHLIHFLMGDGDVVLGLTICGIVAYQDSGVTTIAIDISQVILVGIFQHGGVVCQDGRTLGEGISSAIYSFVDVDVYVVPIDGLCGGVVRNGSKIALFVRFIFKIFYFIIVPIVNSNHIFKYTL